MQGKANTELTVYEREVIRYALRLNRPFRLKDVGSWLNMEHEANRNVLRNLMEMRLIRPLDKGNQRYHEYVLEEKALDYWL